MKDDVDKLIDWCENILRPSIPKVFELTHLDREAARLEIYAKSAYMLDEYDQRRFAIDVCLGPELFSKPFDLAGQEIPGIGPRRGARVSNSLIKVVAKRGCSFEQALTDHVDEVYDECKSFTKRMRSLTKDRAAKQGQMAFRLSRSITPKDLVAVRTWWLEQMEAL